MHLNCLSCESSFVIDPVALGPSGRKVRCGRCGHAWHAEPDASDAADQAPGPFIREGTGPDDPSAKLAAFDDTRQRTHAERRRPPLEGKPRAAAGGWVLFALVVAILVAGVFFGRQQIMGWVSEASVVRERGTESAVPETQIAELAETPPGSSEVGGETVNEPSVQVRSHEPVEQETAALSNGQTEEAEAPAEEVAMVLANATETSGSEAQGAAETPDVPARESFAAHLSSERTRDGTETEWQRLQDLFPKPLDGKKLTVRTIEVAEQGVFYRVMAGPFDDYDKAQDFCSQLKTSAQYCVVRRLTEDPSQ
jgi:predicted Zn finger-like uncharacterized protein